jgi:hypothetical protein
VAAANAVHLHRPEGLIQHIEHFAPGIGLVNTQRAAWVKVAATLVNIRNPNTRYSSVVHPGFSLILFRLPARPVSVISRIRASFSFYFTPFYLTARQK